MKREHECAACDNYFVVSFKGGDLVKFCPFCGEELNPDDGNSFDDNVVGLDD